MSVPSVMSRKTSLITLAWLGVMLVILGLWLMVSLGFALFILGGFVTVVALTARGEMDKKKKEGVG